MAGSGDPIGLSRALLYGSHETRRSLADRLRESGGLEDLAMLVATVRSDEPLLLRARCLEMLGMAAAGGNEQAADVILAALLEPAAAPLTTKEG